MDDIELLARLIDCEAGGEGENGMRAVATVVLNRVQIDSGEYGRYNTVRDVIYAPGQFDCARTSIGGRYNPQNIYNAQPTRLHYDIAAEVLSGDRLAAVYNALWYFNPFSPSCRGQFPNASGRFSIRIGDHCFYVPTDAYYLT